MSKVFHSAGLAWDDEPAAYMKGLAEELEQIGIRLEVTAREEEFRDRVRGEQWRFVVLDLLDESFTPAKETGVALANLTALVKRDDPSFPIFIATNHVTRLSEEVYRALPPNAYARYKMEASWMAYLIRDELRLRGAYVNPAKVFLVGAMQSGTPDPAPKEVHDWLISRGVQSTPIASSVVDHAILVEILNSMEDSAAIVVVLTADDHMKDGEIHGRQNVILELGMALGLGGGMRRVAIVAQGNVKVPSDLDGYLTLRFRTSPQEVLPELETRLRRMGVALS